MIEDHEIIPYLMDQYYNHSVGFYVVPRKVFQWYAQCLAPQSNWSPDFVEYTYRGKKVISLDVD